MAPAAPPEKLGAGLLLCCGGDVLLLQRSPLSGNPGTWGLPGGNADATDTCLLHTARREAEEEMGAVPEFEVLFELLTKRGKKGQKHFTVFVARVPPSVRSSFQPELNEEHTAWRWFPATQAALRSDLHPVVAAALAAEPNKQRVLAAIAAGEGPEAPGKGPAAAAAEPEQTAAAGSQPAERHGRGCSVA